MSDALVDPRIIANYARLRRCHRKCGLRDCVRTPKTVRGLFGALVDPQDHTCLSHPHPEAVPCVWPSTCGRSSFDESVGRG